MRSRWIDQIVADDAVKQAQAEARASKEKAARLRGKRQSGRR